MTEYNNYNTQPKGWKEISAADFSRSFFHYITKRHEMRQIHNDSEGNKVEYKGNSMLFEITYGGWENMGVAMRFEFNNDYNNGEMKYFRYGEDERWVINERKFAAQFAGDNS